MSSAGLETFGLHGLGWSDLAQLWLHFTMLSMLAVAGAITTAPDMERYLVQQQGWLTPEQFSASIAIAQAAPGPNILFVALLGRNAAGPAGLVATMAGILLPSSTVAVAVGRYGRRNADSRAVRAFTAGLVPLTVGLLVATGWLLAAPGIDRWGTIVLVAGTVLTMVRTRISPLWPVAAGAVVGALGFA